VVWLAHCSVIPYAWKTVGAASFPLKMCLFMLKGSD
jgi:hypothetical protein